MGEKLKSPPLIEAVCEFRFDPGTPWDWTIPGQVFARIRNDFPERSNVVQKVELQVQAARTQPITIHTGPERVQLKKSDGSVMVQIGPHLLAVNHLRPYTEWETFLSLIEKVFREYQAVAGRSALSRIGLRYINQIELDHEHSQIGSILTLDPPLRGDLRQPLLSFYQRYEIEQRNPEGVLIHQTGIRESEGRRVVMLDLDFGATKVHGLQNDDRLRVWLNEAHDCVHKAFVASLNPALYEKMKRGDK